jgi:hypothetical protein
LTVESAGVVVGVKGAGAAGAAGAEPWGAVAVGVSDAACAKAAENGAHTRTDVAMIVDLNKRDFIDLNFT